MGSEGDPHFPAVRHFIMASMMFSVSYWERVVPMAEIFLSLTLPESPSFECSPSLSAIVSGCLLQMDTEDKPMVLAKIAIYVIGAPVHRYTSLHSWPHPVLSLPPYGGKIGILPMLTQFNCY